MTDQKVCNTIHGREEVDVGGKIQPRATNVHFEFVRGRKSAQSLRRRTMDSEIFGEDSCSPKPLKQVNRRAQSP